MATTEELKVDEADDREEEQEEEEVSNGESRKPLEAHSPSAPKAFLRSPMAGPKNVGTIALRELRAYFDSLIAYVVVGGSLLGLGVYFFLFQSGGFWQVDRATMSRMFEFMPWALSVLVIPLVTMRALAEEKRSGTIELLITMPVTDSEVILGKYFAALGLAAVLLLCTLVYPVAMFVWPWHMGALDWGPVWTGYLGLLLFCGAGIAVGMMFSSLTESQIIAFFLTAGMLLGLHIVGNVVEYVHGWPGDAIAFVSFQTRFAPFARGLIDTRAVVYFLSIAILCLLVAFRSLESRKWS
jgi:ABC-2 type transport system permease protein